MKLSRISLLLLLGGSICFSAVAQHQPEVRSAAPDKGGIFDVEKSRWHFSRTLSRTALPAFVDNSLSVHFPPIINQKGGSCAQASGIGYLFTYEMNRYLDRAATDENHQFSYLFTWNFLNSGRDEGGFVDEGLNIAVKYGVMTAADYGYASAYQFRWASGFDKYLNAMHYRGRKLYEFPAVTEEDIQHIKAYLYDKGDDRTGGGLLTFSTLTRDWKFEDNYKGPSHSGYHSLLTGLGNDGAHALTIVGYDDAVESTDAKGQKHLGAFIVVNSWGTSFHDQGRFYLPYHFFYRKGTEIVSNTLSDTMTGVEASTHDPQLVYKVELDYSSRDDLSFACGTSDKEDATQPKERHRFVLFRNQGGDYPMQGSYPRNNNMELALDYTPYFSTPDELNPVYFLNIQCAQRGSVSGEGKVKHISLIDYRTPGQPREYVCKSISDTPLQWGDNWFPIHTLPRLRVSASRFSWLNAQGDSPTRKTLLLRTAKGKYAKLRIVGYDKSSGQVTIQYQRSKNGKFINE